MSDLKEYIITLKNFEDLESFYQDMETPGGDLYIPNRQVEVAERRPMSRNTHYYLTDEEANNIANDPRVLGVCLTCEELGIKARPLYFQSSLKWDKSSDSSENDHRNWGLYRCTLSNNVSNWGYLLGGNPRVSGSIDIKQTGKNVDVVIVDGHINPMHPEFAVNSDGTGGSRVNQFNWFSLNSQYLGRPNSTYVYTPYADNPDRTDDNNHGCHVAGTVCGNTQGWARSANIYNLSPYSTNPNSISLNLLIEYVRYFHKNKTVNPATGIKNPTIVNNSWGFGIERDLSVITSLTYRGETIYAPISRAQAEARGIRFVTIGNEDADQDFTAIFVVGFQNASIEADMADAINDGIIFVGAAGNDSYKIVPAGNQDYNNFIATTIPGLSTIFYNRASTPVFNSNVICVGAVSVLPDERKAYFSNTGARVDIYAPGENIMSSVNVIVSTGTYDQRNDQYFITKLAGTSMASPQVCGVLACALEIFPYWNQAGAKDYIVSLAKTGKMTEIFDPSTPFQNLEGGNNRYLFYKNEKNEDSQIYPYNWYRANTQQGQIYPRPRIFSFNTPPPYN